MREFMRSLDASEPYAIEEAWMRLMDASLSQHDLVIVDDMHLLGEVTNGRGYPRPNLLEVAVTAVLEGNDSKKLVFAVEEYMLAAIRRRAQICAIGTFTAADYLALCAAFLQDRADCLDYVRIHRFAPALDAHQLKTACQRMAGIEDLDTDAFIDYLGSQNLTSNVHLDEVEDVDWKDLKGVDDVIRALEVKIALPFEQHELAAQFHLKPKRGVLLAGPPGTGKTTIGRALAHRLKSKFFLIDGTLVAGSDNFYCQLNEIFEAAKRNAPAIIFIDDADVIFENDDDTGVYRYLLTKLDGLEGASAARICVMMTAMNVSSLPAALVRSGRVELWLETRLPDEAARQSILQERVAGLPSPLITVDTGLLAHASRGLTGADLKAAVEDAKLLYAFDWSQGNGVKAVQEYFLDAIATIRTNRRNYARRKSDRPDAVKVGF
jgi:SpoVK/Ycf46/Vps4 family AAA+-type ATPase